MEKRQPLVPVLPFSMAFTIGTAVVTAVCAYFGAQQATQRALADVQTHVAVIEEHNKTVDEHIANIDTSLLNLHNDMTVVLSHFGEKPISTTAIGGIITAK